MSVEVEAVLPKKYEAETSVVVPQGSGAGGGVPRDEFDLLEQKVDSEIERAKKAEGELEKKIDEIDIPKAVTEETVSGWGFTKNTGTYTMPADGIPASDLSQEVQDALSNAGDIPIAEQTETTVEIATNVLNVWGEVATLDITLGEPKVGVINEYMFQFTSGATATTLVLPADIKWVSAPNIQANKTYQVSIINNLGVIGEFGDE